MADKFVVPLGARVKDSISGFEGIVTCRSVWLNGCVRVVITPTKLNKEGSIIPAEVVDEDQVTIIDASPDLRKEVQSKAATTGGDRPSIGRAADPQR